MMSRKTKDSPSQQSPQAAIPGAADKGGGTAEQKFITLFEKKIAPYWRQILWGVLIMVLVAILGVRLILAREAEKTAAYARLDGAESVEELRLLAKDFQGESIAAIALLRRGRMLLEEEESYAEAESAFTQVLEEYADPKYRLPALLGRAYAREAQEEHSQALADFKMIAEQKVTDDLTTLIPAWSGIGRNALALGREEKARQALTKVTESADSGPYAQQAEEFLRELELGRVTPRE